MVAGVLPSRSPLVLANATRHVARNTMHVIFQLQPLYDTHAYCMASKRHTRTYIPVCAGEIVQYNKASSRRG